ncbi:hypothetical protein E1B28_001562 [Marasmius oreades]|uniref:F-box domain-containing protein n=1 Tax=Marasmius oreades TaxID=181124 RepID=A0A9P8AFJ9_9AGAR|nr:uncharacterized protein E1B28_001562 [Marasmius oreades]KAG7099749.1 hypothetical protein E1B28_001562 [Marasmius oreades]
MPSVTTLLNPRPYETCAGRLLLLPLLLPSKPVILPSEVWTHVFQYLASMEGGRTTLWSLVKTSQNFKEIALPLLYSRVKIHDLETFEKLCKRIHEADAKWDSIRRIPYSAPARWVQTLDLSEIPYTGRNQAVLLDGLLTDLFPLLPFLSRFSMNPSFVMSKRAMTALTERPGVFYLRSLSGISYVPQQRSTPCQEPIVELLRNCVNLEELEIIGQGSDPDTWGFDDLLITNETSMECSLCLPLNLPRLRILTLLSTLHFSHLLSSLLISPLPSLTKLTITPSDDIPGSLNSRFISTHGISLRSLLLLSPKSWPTRLHPSPADTLITCPHLRHLSLENPIPQLILQKVHPLEILSITRPNAETWSLLCRILPYLPSLKAVRARDVRWLRKGVGVRAQEAGLQGEMREWRRRLGRRGIRVLDADWHDTE